MTDLADEKQASGRFRPGQSGNPSGRPKGSTASARFAAIVGQDDLAAITKAVVERAKAGDMGAAKMVLDRLYPRPRESSIDLPAIENPEDAAIAMRRIYDALAGGEVSPAQAAALVAVVKDVAKDVPASSPRHLLEIYQRSDLWHLNIEQVQRLRELQKIAADADSYKALTLDQKRELLKLQRLADGQQD